MSPDRSSRFYFASPFWYSTSSLTCQKSTCVMMPDYSNQGPECMPNIKDHFFVPINGKYLSLHDARRLGHNLRDACETCRRRKLRCSGITQDGSPCHRCTIDQTMCIFGTFFSYADIKQLKVKLVVLESAYILLVPTCRLHYFGKNAWKSHIAAPMRFLRTRVRPWNPLFPCYLDPPGFQMTTPPRC